MRGRTLNTIVDTLEVLGDIQITIHPERCVKVRNRNASCTRCLDICPHEALTLNDNILEIDASRCIECAICTTVCPTSALEAQQPNDNEILQKSMRILETKDTPPVFACKPLLAVLQGGYDTSRVIELSCLGRLDESTVIALAALGAQQLYLAFGPCDTCEIALGRSVSDEVLLTLSTLFDAWGLENPLIVSTELPGFVTLHESDSLLSEDEDGLSRREFFTQLKVGVQDATVQAASTMLRTPQPVSKTPRKTFVKVMQDGTLPHFIPNRRELLLDYLEQIGEVQEDFIDTRLWGMLTIDQSTCNSCRMCATFCPTGAIVKYDDPANCADGGPSIGSTVSSTVDSAVSSMGIEHYPADCVQCRLCEDICPSKSVHVDSRVSTKSLLEGEIIRYPMKAPRYRYNQPDQIYRRMYDLLGGGQIYEYGGNNSAL